MPIVVPNFSTTALITGSTLISDADNQLNILMDDVTNYVENTYDVIATSIEGTVATDAASALASANLAEKWASEVENTPVTAGKYSAFHWSQKAFNTVFASSQHILRVDNPHSVTKSQVGLGNADNTADIDKNVLSATKLTTPRNIVLTGDASGTASFNGTANASIVVVVADNSHLHTVTNVTGLQSALDAKVDDTEKGSANGVATLDVNGKVTLTQIPDSVLGQLEYQGVWDFTTLPTATQKGQYWISSISGNGYLVGDWAIWNGLSFDKVDNTDAVASVAGRTGNVVLTKSDVGLNLVDNIADASKNVLSATKLTTTRNIALTGDVTGNVNFDGSANVSIATTVALNSVALGTDTTGNYVAGNTAGTGITVTGTAGEGWSPTISIDGTVATLTGAQTLTNKTLQDSTTFIVDSTDATKKVQFDVAGVTTATTRTMTIPNVNGTLITSGDTGTVTSTMILDGTILNADINTSAGIVDTKLATISTAGKVANTATTATNLNTASAIVARDASGNFTAGTITATLTGNAGTATALATGRTIGMTGDVTWTSAAFNGSGNVTGVSTLATITDSGTGTFKKVTTNTKGLVTGTQAVSQADITGLLGTGSITNTMLANTAITNLSGTNTGDQTITLTGDVTGSGTGSFATTLANSGVTAGTFSKVTVDAKGRVTAGLTPTMEDIPDATFKRSVKVATTANITLSAPQTIDGIAVVALDRVLVKNQTTTSQNGIYVVNAGAWTRALDADTASKIASALVAVDSGTTNGGKLFDNDFKTTDIIGTTAMLWSMNLDEGSLLTVGSTSVGIVKYNGTTAAAGNFDGGTTTPTGANRLNYGGYFYPTYLNLTASGVETAASSHILMEKSSDGFVRRKTLANFKTEMFASPTLVTPTISGKSTNPYVSINRAVTVASGIEWYNSTFNAWVDYMAQAGVAGQGPKGTITPSVGTLVTSWGKRSFIENAAGCGWTFESGLSSATSPTVMAEISSVDGSAKFGGTVTAPSFVGSLSGNAESTTILQTARTISGVSFNGSANINIEDRLGTAVASAATTTVGTAGLGDYMHITGVVTITSLGTASVAGIRRTLIFDGALTLTHNATSLICPGAASIVTVAGTVIEVIAETTANWRVVSVTHPSIGMAELGYLDGVTSAIQTQMNLKAPLASPALTGTPTAPTAVIATNSTQVATTAFAKLASDPINSLRTDRYLALQNIANMIYTSGNLTKIQYNNATDVNYEVLAYDVNSNLSTIQHYVASTLKGTTTLSYTGGNLVSAIFVGV